jgi:hypothetical protein
LEIVRSASSEIIEKPFIKFLGDGALIFATETQANPMKFISLAETVAKRVEIINRERYSSKPFAIEFKCALDYGSDIYLFRTGDPQGTVIDRAFRICSYLTPNTIAASAEYCERIANTEVGKRFSLAGRAYLKGISERWQDIYALNDLKGFAIRLASEQLKKEALTDIFEVGKEDKPIWVVGGAIRDSVGDKASTYSMQHGDNNALIEIVHSLTKAYPNRQIQIVNSEDYLRRNGPVLDNDIVCISGPDFNVVTRRLIKEIPLDISFVRDKSAGRESDDPVVKFIDAERQIHEFRTERDRSRAISSDPAIFVKWRRTDLAGGEQRFVYIMMGSNTQGTYAAASVFGISCPHLLENHAFLKDNLPHTDIRAFGFIANATVIQDYTEPILLRRADNLKTFYLTSSRKDAKMANSD